MMEEKIKDKFKKGSYEKLERIKNKKIQEFISKFISLCNPSSVFVRDDSKEDALYIRKRAIEIGEEGKLITDGHTYHFDGYYDQARDKENTKFMITEGLEVGPLLNSIDRDEAYKEITEILKNIMNGKELYILFLCLGPVNSPFSIYAVQLTDSAYVAHSEDILYRPAYSVFTEKEDIEFFKFVHSAGQLTENKTSKNVDKRRIYVDFVENIVFSANTQYAGNTVGLKKLALRLAIRKATEEKWLAEHMFIMGVKGENRKSYFLGAFPSMCGKTSTCMVRGETIIGDDIAYLKKRDGKIYAANIERGIFGIIQDVNEKDDPLIWKALNTEGEIIFSNILVSNGKAFWNGCGKEIPDEGINFSGKWWKGKKDENGKEIPPSHPNARYTIRLNSLENFDSEGENPDGVEVSGIIFGGRDSDTWPPVFESFNWIHGVITIGASLESETTAATLGKSGIRKFNIMANMDFISVPLSKYIENYLEFGEKDLRKVPKIFGVNYFLRDENGNYLTDKQAKRVWLKWMEKRVYNEISAIKTPIGFIPEYNDLKNLFNEVLSQNYSKQDYIKQFSLRVSNNITKMERIIGIYRNLKNIPEIVFETLQNQKKNLIKLKEEYGDVVSPYKLKEIL